MILQVSINEKINIRLQGKRTCRLNTVLNNLKREESWNDFIQCLDVTDQNHR